MEGQRKQNPSIIGIIQPTTAAKLGFDLDYIYHNYNLRVITDHTDRKIKKHKTIQYLDNSS